MTPEAIIEDRRFQETLDKIRKEEGYDFAAIAFYESNKPSSPIKWHYVSGNKNNRFKLIILRKGRGLAGTVMKTGKRIINSSLSCTALVQKSSVWCTIIWSKRWTFFTKNI